MRFLLAVADRVSAIVLFARRLLGGRFFFERCFVCRLRLFHEFSAALSKFGHIQRHCCVGQRLVRVTLVHPRYGHL